ncbi:alkaline phosphatase family protein [Halomonas sp. GXIMD04776]|uniref:alkaline phosphatase family protein n=1 Tax=Halomonas sp. GXIMD04776 TaxID=3415605 RepID=UPI003C97D0F7
MKLLIIGIDGGDYRIINEMPMPFLQSLVKGSTCVPVEEDLWERGWAKILSGKSGKETGAFYTKPVLSDEKECKATQSFRLNDYATAGAIPLWQKLNEMGLRVGFMNIPTTSPAPEVDGFFVSGAGAGLGKKEGIPSEACSPSEVATILEAQEYIFDTRYVASGIRDQESFIRRLRLMTERRVRSYCSLNEKYAVDIGFIAFMGTTRIQYLAMSEIEKMIDQPQEKWSKLQKDIAELYQHFDEQLRRLTDTIKPKHTVVVSDHGQSPYKQMIDVGAFLKSHGWQTDRAASNMMIRNQLKAVIKKTVPDFLLKKVSGSAPKIKDAIVSQPIDFSKSHAFGMRYVSGIYINDERFGGVAKSEKERKEIVKNIIEEFNKSNVAQEYCLSARPYRDSHQDTRQCKLLPDIWIDHPDSIFFEYGIGGSRKGTGNFVEANEVYGKEIDWPNVSRDQWTGIKGRYPLLTVSNSAAHLIPENMAEDLTSAYSIVVNIASE